MLAGCGVQQPEEPPAAETQGMEATQKETAEDPAVLVETELTYEELPESYLLASGAGGWSTQLFLQAKGFFNGEYHNSDMGSTGTDYPNGTVYRCRFSGWLGLLEQEENGAWSMEILSLETQDEPETVWYEDGKRIIGSTAYGLEGAKKLIVYPAGFPIKDLSENFHAGWAREYLHDKTELPDTILYNGEEILAFVEYEFS